MESTTVRISKASHGLLRKLAKHTHASMNEVLDAALAEYQKRLFWSKAAAEFQAMRKDPKAWKAEEEERKAWDAALNDGLDE